MRHKIRVILGCCAFSALIQFPHSVIGFADAASLDQVPLFHVQHSRELLRESDRADKNMQAKEYASYVQRRMRELLPMPYKKKSRLIANALIETANRHKMDPLFLMAVIKQESSFNPRAKGRFGEIGLMQLKPTTARWLLKKKRGKVPSERRVAKLLFDPVQNIRIGGAYLADLRKKFNGRTQLYISAYNMGPVGVRNLVKTGVQPREYSTKVLARYMQLVGGLAPSREIAASRTFDL